MGRVSASPRRQRRPPSGTAFERLVEIMATLRSPQGCAWDRRQTHRSLRRYLIEETYEAVDAIDRRDMRALCDELGDVLLQVVFHAELAAGSRRFTIRDVIDAVSEKLVRRHPHVFDAAGRPLSAARRARAAVATPAQVKAQWQRIKADERMAAGQRAGGVLEGVPEALPALARASKIGGRVAAVGFDWPRAADVIRKVEEELRELRGALHESDARAAEEMGDVLFSVANLARKLHIDPENALREANDKFTRRFAALERHLAGSGRPLPGASPEEMEAAWILVKQRGRRLRPPVVSAGAKSPAATSVRRRSARRRATRRSR
jgi:MazG family protein